MEFAEILQAVGMTEGEFAQITTYDTPDEVAYKQLKMIGKVFNKGADPSDCHYEAWFVKVKDPSKPRGFGLSFHIADCVISASYVASRLKFIDRATARRAAAEFLPIFEAYLL